VDGALALPESSLGICETAKVNDWEVE